MSALPSARRIRSRPPRLPRSLPLRRFGGSPIQILLSLPDAHRDHVRQVAAIIADSPLPSALDWLTERVIQVTGLSREVVQRSIATLVRRRRLRVSMLPSTAIVVVHLGGTAGGER